MEALMEWKTQPKLLAPQLNIEWSRGFAQIPTPIILSDGRVRIFYSTRDERNYSHTLWVDVAADDPLRILDFSSQPILPLGEKNSFDECGIMPACAFYMGDEIWLYYTGWRVPEDVPYRLEIGLAISVDGGKTFTKKSDESLIGAQEIYQYGTTSPFIFRVEGKLQMLFSVFSPWQKINGRLESRYSFQRAISADGLRWQNCGVPEGLEIHDDFAAIRATGFYAQDKWNFCYCARRVSAFRDDRDAAYHLVFMHSDDGIKWQKSRQENIFMPSDFAQIMQAYPYIYRAADKIFMLYNGDNFGRAGILIAEMDGDF